MNKAIFSFFFLIMALTASSQRIYFVYLQTESQQPFFVKMDEKIYSSTASGYLILSRLKDSVYNFSVGFPGNTAGEQKFSCSINKKDHGYLLRNFGEKGWGIFDLQTLSVQMSASDAKKDVSVTNAAVNAFTDLLSKAADDETLKQKIVVAEEKKPEVVAKTEVKKEDLKPEEKTVTTPVVQTPAVTTTAKTIPQKEEPKKEVTKVDTTAKAAPQKETIKKEEVKPPLVTTTAKTIAQKEEPKKEAVQVDTIAKTVPQKETINKEVKQTIDTVANTGKKPDKIVVKETPVPTADGFVRTKIARKSESSTTDGLGLVFVDVYPDGKQDTIRLIIPNDAKYQLTDRKVKDTVVKKEVTPANETVITTTNITPAKTVVKNSCKQVATDDDFYKLRKKMAAEKSDNDMLGEAVKAFKAKCFTTMQVKNLCTLFLGDGGRYKFFDAAYTHITDADNFASLQSELKDEYFVNRFKAMIR